MLLSRHIAEYVACKTATGLITGHAVLLPQGGFLFFGELAGHGASDKQFALSIRANFSFAGEQQNAPTIAGALNH
ncbi:hypothetical protein VI01_03925 [Pantoea sp. SM3]|nr:hypothetical protein VI01_03925 [Pantoea sp. SM3]